PKMDDSEFDLILQGSKLKYVKEISARLLARRLFKRALYTDMGSMEWSVDSNPNSVRRIEAELAEMADVEPEYVLTDIPKMPEIPEIKAGVEIKGKVVGLDAVSRLVGTIAQAHRDNWRLGVYTIPEHREAVGKAAREFFKVKRETRQFVLTEL
ncbi:MAG TPA: HD domain-containing protein, partial [Candidatus Methanoperedenaceae archaeon]|nr:HD domain-containing protein [Candidatus Methanoperedenaceae archaeon]